MIYDKIILVVRFPISIIILLVFLIQLAHSEIIVQDETGKELASFIGIADSDKTKRDYLKIEISLFCEDSSERFKVVLNSEEFIKYHGNSVFDYQLEQIDPCVFSTSLYNHGYKSILKVNISDPTVKIKQVLIGKEIEKPLSEESQLLCGINYRIGGSNGSCSEKSIAVSKFGCDVNVKEYPRIFPKVYYCDNASHGSIRYKTLHDFSTLNPKDYIGRECFNIFDNGYFVCRRLILWKDGEYKAINNLHQWFQHNAPINTPRKALTYSLLVVPGWLSNHEYELNNISISDKEVEDHVNQLPDGSFEIRLIQSSGNFCGDTNDIYYWLIFTVSPEGILTKKDSKFAFEKLTS